MQDRGAAAKPHTAVPSQMADAVVGGDTAGLHDAKQGLVDEERVPPALLHDHGEQARVGGRADGSLDERGDLALVHPGKVDDSRLAGFGQPRYRRLGVLGLLVEIWPHRRQEKAGGTADRPGDDPDQAERILVSDMQVLHGQQQRSLADEFLDRLHRRRVHPGQACGGLRCAGRSSGGTAGLVQHNPSSLAKQRVVAGLGLVEDVTDR